MKTTVKLDGVPVSANAQAGWRFQTGVQPYVGYFTVHKSQWDNLKGKVGNFAVKLVVVDARNVTTTIEELFIVERVASDSPNRVTFKVVDRRYWWSYKLVVRDYNTPKKTGDRTVRNLDVPVEKQVTTDEYDFRPYSLKDGKKRWKVGEALSDVLELIEEDPGKWTIDSLPVNDGDGEGAFNLQGQVLRDPGDMALARILSLLPGARVWVDQKGVVRIFDGADVNMARQYLKELPPNTWDGDKWVEIDRGPIRPKEIRVHYQREMELLLSYSDNLGGNTASAPVQLDPFIQNVVPTTDVKTTVFEYDPLTNTTVTKTDVPPGTYVEFQAWLFAMDKIKPEGSLPWTFETLKFGWLSGDLDGLLGGRGFDLDPLGNVAMRIQAVKQHFRQTFRINRLYTERTRGLTAVRAAVLDPVTGARAPASVWGQACIVPTTKGKLMASRNKKEKAGAFRNVNYLPEGEEDVLERTPGPTAVNFIDRDLGIFRLQWLLGPYGVNESFIPCHLVSEKNTGTPKVPTRDMSEQDNEPTVAGGRIEGATNGLQLRPTLEYKIMITMVPAAPNNKDQFHQEVLTFEDLSPIFRTEFGIKAGSGPPLDLFIPPGELTARFGWQEDDLAQASIKQILGLGEPDPNKAGLKFSKGESGREIPGFFMANGQREIHNHSRATAAQAISTFADSLEGRVSTIIPTNGLHLKGNMTGATIQVGRFPSGKTSVLHEFSGVPNQVSRFSLLPNEARALILGLLPFKDEA